MIKPRLDPGFAPAILHERDLFQGMRTPERLVLAVEREDGCIVRRELAVASEGSARSADTLAHVERVAKFMLWSAGGWRLYLGGPDWIGRHLAAVYTTSGKRAFDVGLMERIYEKTFETVACAAEAVPPARENETAIGGHLDGCRIGFDLGASDYKVAAVQDGVPVFTAEIPWDPVRQSDPDYHYNAIHHGIELAAAHLPRVDAIGGSSAGVYVHDRPMVASLFRAVPVDLFEAKAKNMFCRLRDEWGVPLVVINDGDVTALAGAMALRKRGMLGIAMGSSEAGGFLDRQGRVTGRLNELAFAPVDFNPRAAADEWSGDTGVGALYFSQQAVGRLAPAAGFHFPVEMGLPERLKAVQEKADAGDVNALDVFRTIGVYLGYTLPWYAQFYDYEDVLVLGRVASGRGGEQMTETAKTVLEKEFPEFAAKVQIHVPDEKTRRVGQAVAAASLPEIGK